MSDTKTPARTVKHESHPVILFDGVCNLCEFSVQFIIRRDRDAQFRFASLQSETGQKVLAQHDYADDTLSSVLLIEDGVLYRKSRAALRIARRLDRLWPVFYYCLYWVPDFIADALYDLVGSRRYRWFGKKSACWIPDVTHRHRFLDLRADENPLP